MLYAFLSPPVTALINAFDKPEHGTALFPNRRRQPSKRTEVAVGDGIGQLVQKPYQCIVKRRADLPLFVHQRKQISLAILKEGHP
jgi:hypothetical protein